MSNPPKKQSASQAFAELLKELREQLGLTQADLAEKLSVSPKTVARWETKEGAPDLLQAHGVVARIALASPALHARAAEVLGVPLPPQPVAVAPNMAILKAALDGALFEATELLQAPPQKVRDAVMIVLARVSLIGVDAKTAAKLMGGKG